MEMRLSQVANRQREKFPIIAKEMYPMQHMREWIDALIELVA